MPHLAVIQNDPEVPLDLLEPLLPGAQIYRANEALPDLDKVDGLVILGGLMSAHDGDKYPWLFEEMNLIVRAAEQSVPVLAICLGAQLVAEATGGLVEVGAAPGPEHGIIQVHLTPLAEADPTFALVKSRLGDDFWACSSHDDAVFALPPGATWLARSDLYHFHAFRWKSILSVQFHPEAGADLMAKWASFSGDDIEELRHDFAVHESDISTLSEVIAEGFLAEVSSSSLSFANA